MPLLLFVLAAVPVPPPSATAPPAAPGQENGVDLDALAAAITKQVRETALHSKHHQNGLSKGKVTFRRQFETGVDSL